MRIAKVSAALVFAGSSLLLACSFISTSDLTGGSERGVTCTGPSCSDAAPEAAATEAGSDACAANVQTDAMNCGMCGHACASGMRCASGACVAGCGGGTMYVSGTSGSDAFDGCSEAKPKKTVGAALTSVHNAPTSASEIHVCRGTYMESGLALDVPVSLRGGYDCLAWVRTASFGYPTFDGLSLTVLQATDASANGITLAISNPLGSNVQVDGFQIIGPSKTPPGAPSEAVSISGASVAIHDNEILGAEQSTSDTRGIGMQLAAAPDIYANHVDGGGGDLMAQAITVALSSTPKVHGNRLTTRASANFTVGFRNFSGGGAMRGAFALFGNTIEPGPGVGVQDLGGSFGVMSDNPIDIIGNTITGGTVTCAAGVAPCISYGLFLHGHNASDGAIVAGNRIVAGSATPGHGEVDGVELLGMGPSLFVNNAIQASTTQPASALLAFAVRLDSSPDVTLDHNTIFATNADVILVRDAAMNASNNLFLGNPNTSIGAFYNQSCADAGVAGITGFSGNALVGFGAALATTTSPSGCAVTTIGSFASLATNVPLATANVRTASTCPSGEGAACVADTACTGAGDGAPCIASVLAGWDDATQGVQTLFDPSLTWKLGTNAPCAIAKGGVPLTDMLAADAGYPDVDAGTDASAVSVGVDINGAPRTAPVSIGAYEDDGACQ